MPDLRPAETPSNFASREGRRTGHGATGAPPLRSGAPHPSVSRAPRPRISGTNPGKLVAIGPASSTVIGAFAARPRHKNASPKKDKLSYVLQIHFTASNNVAEYEALVHGLKVAKEIGIRRIQCFGDSDLVV